jgi:hypothetical protein
VQGTNPEQISLQLRDVLGKSFGPEIAVLQTNFEELGSKMKNMGAIMDGTTAIELKQFKDEMGLIGMVITSQLAPALIMFGKAIILLVADIKSVGAYLGGLTQKTKPGDVAKGLLPGGLFSLVPKLDFKAAKEEAGKPWEEAFNQIDAIDEAAKKWSEKLSRPSTPVFEEGRLATPKKAKAVEGDALTKVGNFLGTSRAAINGAQERMVVASEKTAINTAQIANTMTQLVMRLLTGGNIGQQPAGQIDKTFFPIN